MNTRRMAFLIGLIASSTTVARRHFRSVAPISLISSRVWETSSSRSPSNLPTTSSSRSTTFETCSSPTDADFVGAVGTIDSEFDPSFIRYNIVGLTTTSGSGIEYPDVDGRRLSEVGSDSELERSRRVEAGW